MITAVILCGGSGTRLWPTSRRTLPKQFHVLTGDKSSFQETLARIADLEGFAEPVIITGEDHVACAREQLAALGLSARILVEPAPRDSAAAVAAAAEYLARSDPDAVLLVLAADHHIAESGAFRGAMGVGARAAEHGHVVLFGIVPDGPATGYGYIEPAGDGDVRMVRSFTEKPDAETARALIAKGCLWNSGNFAFRADVILAELAEFAPEIATAARLAVANGSAAGNEFRLDGPSFGRAPKLSLDRAVMERTDRAMVIPIDVGWRDLGTWDAVWEASPHDADGNVLRGPVVAVDTRNILVRSADMLVAAIGVEDLVIVASNDAVLVCRRDVAQSVRDIIDLLPARPRPDTESDSGGGGGGGGDKTPKS